MNDHHRKITILLFILQNLIANKRYQNIPMQKRFNIYHLLAFNYAVMNATIPLIPFSPPNTRIQHQPRPRTEGFWTDVFPFLVDGDNYNFFRSCHCCGNKLFV